MKNKNLKPVPADKKKSLGKLSVKVRSKMGFMEKGGIVKEGEQKFSDITFGKTYHPITELQMSTNIRKNFEGDKKFAGIKELDDAHEKLKTRLLDKNVRPSEILKIDKEFNARKERAKKRVQNDLSDRPGMKELRKKTKGTVTDTGSSFSKGGLVKQGKPKLAKKGWR